MKPLPSVSTRSIVVRSTLFAITLAFLSFNQVLANPDMRRFSDMFKQDPPEKFKAVLNQFIAAGRIGDIEKMLGLSSRSTIQEIGLAQLQQTYKNKFVPVIQSCQSFANNKTITHLSAKQTGSESGYMYQFSCERFDSTVLKFKAYVLNENNKIMLTFFGPDNS